jgi:hypothetical protein
MKMLDLKKSRFSELLKKYKNDQGNFHINYGRSYSNNSFNKDVAVIIDEEINAEQAIIEDENISTVTNYNFEALSLAVQRHCDQKVSASTLRRRAIELGLHKPNLSRNKVYRQFERGGFGSLFQHDASIHKWSPYMPKFYLIMTIDDHTRYIVGARFFMEETSMNHIYCLEEVALCYGIAKEYYVDRHAIFTGQDRNGWHNKAKKKKEEFEVQFKMVCEDIETKLIYAQSANAKGKIERPFRYIQDHVCRWLARTKATTLQEAQTILDEVIAYYNENKVHSSTQEIPQKRLQRAVDENRYLARSIPKELDVENTFCLRATRSIDKFNRISYLGHKIKLPGKERRWGKVDIKIRVKDGWNHLNIFHKQDFIKQIQVQKKQKKKKS